MGLEVFGASAVCSRTNDHCARVAWGGPECVAAWEIPDRNMGTMREQAVEPHCFILLDKRESDKLRRWWINLVFCHIDAPWETFFHYPNLTLRHQGCVWALPESWNNEV